MLFASSLIASSASLMAAPKPAASVGSGRSSGAMVVLVVVGSVAVVDVVVVGVVELDAAVVESVVDSSVSPADAGCEIVLVGDESDEASSRLEQAARRVAARISASALERRATVREGVVSEEGIGTRR